MPAVTKTLLVEAGSYEPQYWLLTDPGTGLPIDLTVSGFAVSGHVAARAGGSGALLLTLTDTSFRRTNQGRVYFQPASTDSAGWTFTSGYYQFELTHPSGETVRFAQGLFRVSPEVVHI